MLSLTTIEKGFFSRCIKNPFSPRGVGHQGVEDQASQQRICFRRRPKGVSRVGEMGVMANAEKSTEYTCRDTKPRALRH